MLAAVDSDTKVIYVQLLEEGTRVFRPTQGIRLEGEWFRLLPTDDYDPDDEVWEFPPGSTVRCELRRLNGEMALVAVAAE